MNNNLLKILLLFFVVFFVNPFLTHIFFQMEMSSIYRGTQDFVAIIFILIIFFFFFISYISQFGKPKKTIEWPNLLENKFFIKALSLVFLFLSLYFYSKYDYKFRHTGESLAEAGGYIILLTGLRSLFKAYLFISIVYEFKFNKIYNSRYVYFILALSFWFSKVSSLDLPLIFISILIFLRKVFVLISRRSSRFNLINNNIIRVFLIISISLTVIFMGLANKIGYERAKSIFMNKAVLEKTLFAVNIRFSTYYASVFGAYEAYEKSSPILANSLPGAFENTINRFIYLFEGKKVERPRVWSIYRGNFLNLFRDNYNDRTGASPGIVASIFYFNNLFVGVIVIFTYIFFMVKFLKETMECNMPRLNITGIFFFFIFIIPYFESPLDYINIFNPSFIYLYFTIVSLKKINHDKSVKINSSRIRSQR